MAFIRSYQAQGDPRARRTTLRAGRLYHSKLLSVRTRGFGGRTGRVNWGGRAFARLPHAGGDPFSLRMPKWVRKLQPGKALMKLAPLAGGLVGGPVGAALGSALAGSLAGGNVAPEMAMQPAPSGPPAQVAMQYQVGGTEVTPATSGQVYNVFQGARSRSSGRLAEYDDYGPDDEDEDVADVGDEDEYEEEE